MKRFVLGPVVEVIGVRTSATAPDAPAGKLVPEITAAFLDVVADGDDLKARLAIGRPAYSLDSHDHMVAVHAISVPKGHGVPETPELFVASSYPRAVLPTAFKFEAGTDELEVPISYGENTVQTVLELDNDFAPGVTEVGSALGH